MNATNNETHLSPESNAKAIAAYHLLEKVKELLREANPEPEKQFGCPTFAEVAALMRRFKRDKFNYPKHDCSANRAREAAEIVGKHLGLTHEQFFFFCSFVGHVSQISESRGFREGLVYEDKKQRKEMAA